MKESFYTKSCEFAVKAFNYLNTRVNRTRIPFFQLDTSPNNSSMGHVVNGVMTLNIHNILELAKNNDKYDWPNIKGLIILTIVHELSHINQNIDYDRFSKDDTYHDKIEIENHYNALNFILNREEELHGVFGDYSDDICLDLELTQQCLENPQYKNSYKMRNTDTVAMITMVNMFSNVSKAERSRIYTLMMNATRVVVHYRETKEGPILFSDIVKDEHGIWYTYKIFNIVKFLYKLPAYNALIMAEGGTDLVFYMTREESSTPISENAGQYVANIINPQ